MKQFQLISLMLMLISLFSCDGRGQDHPPVEQCGEFAAQQFTLKLHESKNIAGAGLEITVNRIGRKWTNKSESLDFIFTVKHDGKSQTYSVPWPDLIIVGDYQIEVLKTEPFGEGYATFLVGKKMPTIELPQPSSKSSVGILTNPSLLLKAPVNFPTLF